MKAFIDIVLKMSVYGSIAILLVLILRSLFRKVPKKTVVLFWIVAAVRLVCPLNFGTSVSLFNLAPQSVTENLRPLYFIDNESDASITPLNAFVPGTVDVSASLAPGTDNTVKTDANGVTPSNVPHPSVGSADHTAETFPAADVTTGSFMPAASDETSSSSI